MEKNYTKRELDFFKDDLFKRLDKQDEALSRIEEQTTRHNGRMSKIEEDIKDLPDLRTKVSQLDNYKWWIVGVGAAFVLLGGAIATLIYNQIDNKIIKGIDTAFNTRFSKIEVVK